MFRGAAVVVVVMVIAVWGGEGGKPKLAPLMIALSAVMPRLSPPPPSLHMLLYSLPLTLV